MKIRNGKSEIEHSTKQIIDAIKERGERNNGFQGEVMEKYIKIFISHSEHDSKLAEYAVNLLLSSLEIHDSSIRCTSVVGHQLEFGENIPILLKKDIKLTLIIIVLITNESLNSKWVTFELGASWVLNKTIIPILGPGLNNKDLPGPLSDLPCIQIDKPDCNSRIRDAIKQISDELGINEKTGGKSQSNLEAFVSEFKKYPNQRISNKLNENPLMRGSIVYEKPAYWRVDGDIKDGPFCQRCYDSEQKTIRLQIGINNDVWKCLECKSVYYGPRYKNLPLRTLRA